MKPVLAKLVLAAAVTAGLSAIVLVPAQAEAHRVRFGVHLRGRVSVHIGAPVVVQPRPVAVGYYDPYQPPPPPPPQPASYYYPPAEPAPVVAYGPPRRPVLGLGLGLTSIDVNEGELEGEGASIFGRLRLGQRWQLELSMGQDRFGDNPRVDTRVGGALLYELGQPGGLTPYVLVGLGANVIQPLGEMEDVDPDTLPQQSYAEAGVGLGWEASRHFTLSGELRLQGRQLVETEGQARSFPGATPMQTEENVAEARLNLIYWF